MVYQLLRSYKGKVVSRGFWRHPAQLIAEVRHVIKFAAPEYNSGREVEYFLKPVEVFFLAVSVDGETILDSRDD